jgi:hypothetical protein
MVRDRAMDGYHSLVSYHGVIAIVRKDAYETRESCDMRAWFICKNAGAPNVESWSKLWAAHETLGVTYAPKVMAQLKIFKAHAFPVAP